MPTAPEKYRIRIKTTRRGRTVNTRFYSSSAWRRVSRQQLRREPLCRSCGRPAVQVDHIIPLLRGGAEYDAANLQSLCLACHCLKTNRERYERSQ